MSLKEHLTSRIKPTSAPIPDGAENGENEITERTSESDDEKIDPNAQAGVQKVEAVTAIWTKSNLIIAYILIFIIFFVDSMQQQISFSLSPYVTSSFLYHSLTATTSVLSSIIGGLIKLPLAKVLDIWGRPQGFALMVFCLVIGLVMMAACNNVETYAAAQVFYWVGQNGIAYTLDVFIADTSALKNRSLMFAFVNAPYIATTWIGGPAASGFLTGAGWRWGFGTFTIVTPVICSPLYILLKLNERKAKKAGLLPPRNSGRTFGQSIMHYLIEFDALGILLLAGGLALFLLPFSLYSYQSKGWASAMIICMIVFGVALIISFVIYEKYFAPKSFIPFSLLTDRTVLGAGLMFVFLFFSWYIWDSFFPSLLQVVYGLNVTESSYVTNIYSIGSCFWALLVGVFVRYTGRFKWISLYFGVPLTILGVGLMIEFRRPDVNIGYIVMCQIFIAFAGGTLVITGQLAAMAAASHQHIAVVLAVLSFFSSIGGAIGQSVAAAVWTGLFPDALARYLPPESQDNLANIYGSLTVQLSYPLGSPTRNAINRAYGDAQRVMLIAAVIIHIGTFISVAIWRDIKVKEFRQVKGRVID